MKKRVLSIMLSLMVGSTCLLGCDNNSKPEEKPAVTEEKMETSAKTNETTEEVSSEESVDGVSFDWSDKEYVKNVPLPDTDKTSIQHDDDYAFWVHINGDKEAFTSYVEKCKEAGFNIQPQSIDGTLYAAYDKEGTYISVALDGTQYELVVRESKINNTFTWPSVGMATKIPKLDSTVGTVDVDTSSTFAVYVGEIEEDEFKAYVEECIGMGFNQDYQKGDTYFNGKNQNGDSIQIRYEGVNTMFIRVEEKGDETE